MKILSFVIIELSSYICKIGRDLFIFIINMQLNGILLKKKLRKICE